MKLLKRILCAGLLINGSGAVVSMESDAFEFSHGPSNNQYYVNAAHRTVSNVEKKPKKHSIILNEQEKSSQTIESGKSIKETLERRKSILAEKSNNEE